MRSSGFGTVLFSFGLIFLAFGFTFTVIELLATAFGTRREIGVMLAVSFLAIGALLVGGGVFMNKSQDRRQTNL